MWEFRRSANPPYTTTLEEGGTPLYFEMTQNQRSPLLMKPHKLPFPHCCSRPTLSTDKHATMLPCTTSLPLNIGARCTWYEKANIPTYWVAADLTGYRHCYPTYMAPIKIQHWPRFFWPLKPFSTTTSRIVTTDRKARFEFKSHSKPQLFRHCPVPYAVAPTAEQELDRLQKNRHY